MKQKMIELMTIAIDMVIPQRKGWLEGENESYRKGWNDCARLVKKNGKDYLKFLEKHL